jgi:hypothetical protein
VHSHFHPEEEETVSKATHLADRIAQGNFKNIIVLTGAGVSTASNIPDYRSEGGLYEILINKYAKDFPEVNYLFYGDKKRDHIGDSVPLIIGSITFAIDKLIYLLGHY